MVAQSATATIMESRQPTNKRKSRTNEETSRSIQESSDKQSGVKENASSNINSTKNKQSASINDMNKRESENKSFSKMKTEKSKKSIGNECKVKTSRNHSSKDKKMDSKTENNLKNNSKLAKINQSAEPKSDQSKRQKNNESDIDFSMIENKIFEGVSLEKQGKKDGAKYKSNDKNLQNKSSSKKGVTDKNNVKKLSIDKKKGGKSETSETKRKTVERSDRKKKEPKNSSKSPNSSKPSKKTGSLSHDKKRREIKQDSGDSDMSDWEAIEDVDEMDLLFGDSRETVAHDAGDKEVVTKIELDAENKLWGMSKKRKKRSEQDMIEDYLRKCANQSIRDVWENMHKTHLLCLFAHGRFINMQLNSEILLGSALSIVTDKKVYPPKRLDMKYLESFTSWFARKILLVPQKLEKAYWDSPFEEIMQDRFEQKKAYSSREFVFMFILLCRALGMNVRLVMSFLPISWKPSMDNLIRPKKKEDNDLFKEEFGADGSTASTSQTITMDMVEGLKSREKNKTGENENKKEITKKKIKDKNSRKMLTTDSEDEEKNNRKKKANKKKSSKKQSDDSFDDDFDPEILKIKKGPKNVKKTKESEKNNKRKSEEDGQDESRKRRKDGLTEWAEIYVEEEEKWVCVDVCRGKIHCVAEIESRAPPPVAYVTAYNADQTVKDVTPRYNSTWLSSEDKVRCASGWWSKSIRPFRGARTRKDREEDNEMQQSLEKAPLPGTISQYKNHPMYALQRHLLKYEAIYPTDIVPLGHLKKEPVYPRDAVKTLRSRNLWEREARSVRTDEEPFKIVKAMPKWDRATRTMITDRPLELFGEWQTEPYEPPIAMDGKVPRNEYGNVELYKQCMMPRGCIQLMLPGLNRLCKKIGVDCAPAMTGFEYHKGSMHPTYEGFIICEEFKELVLDAWDQEQVELAKREEEKREKRVYDNWRKLIKGMLIKQRVRENYGKMTPEDEEDLKQYEAEIKKREAEKKRIKQADLDAALHQGEAETSRPPIITHHVPNMKIDLTCSVVEMAKKSRELSMKSKNVARKKTVKRKYSIKSTINASKGLGSPASANMKAEVEASTLESDEEEEDPEEKKARIRSILKWGTESQTNPDLSEDSDDEISKNSKYSSSDEGLDFSGFLSPKKDSSDFSGFSSPKKSSSRPYHSTISKAVSKAKGKVKKQVKKQVRKRVKSESEESVIYVASDKSTTPEPEINKSINAKRPRSRRTAVQKKTYKESENESEADISIDESDCEDKSYNPNKDKLSNLKFADSLVLSEESD